MTYEQIAESSEYSTNYLMRDVEPRFWRLLSDAMGEPASKTNIRVLLEQVEQSNSQSSNSQSSNSQSSNSQSSNSQLPTPSEPSTAIAAMGGCSVVYGMGHDWGIACVTFFQPIAAVFNRCDRGG